MHDQKICMIKKNDDKRTRFRRIRFQKTRSEKFVKLTHLRRPQVSFLVSDFNVPTLPSVHSSTNSAFVSFVPDQSKNQFCKLTASMFASDCPPAEMPAACQRSRAPELRRFVWLASSFLSGSSIIGCFFAIAIVDDFDS